MTLTTSACTCARAGELFTGAERGNDQPARPVWHHTCLPSPSEV